MTPPIRENRRTAKQHETKTCVVCDKPIEVARFMDQTAAGQITRHYAAWCPVGEQLRGSEEPLPHWCHPEGGSSTGEAGTLR